MSCPHLHPDTIAACVQAAFDYHPACYCVFAWVLAEPPPGRKYTRYGNKWLQVNAWWSMGNEADRHLVTVQADTGPELLRNLRATLADLGPARLPAKLPPVGRPLRPEPGNGWIPSAAQTTQPLNAWPF